MCSLNKKEVIFTTVTTTSYLPRAMIMAESVKKHVPNSKVVACIVEEKIPTTTASLDTYFDKVLLAKDLGFPNFYRFIFQYNQAEGSNACKAQLLIYLLETFKSHDYFIFLDSDTKVFGSFVELMEHIEKHEIIFSPHFIGFNEKEPLYHLEIVHRSGIFNTGFFAVKRGREADRFLRWWAKLLLKYCYISPKKGLWNEQKWLDLASGLFEFHIQTDPGYNVGPWNFHERLITLGHNGEYMVNGRPLSLFHFSGVSDKFFNLKLAQTHHRHKAVIGNLRKEYLDALFDVDMDLLSQKAWSYNYFISGRRIYRESRLIFWKHPELFVELENPFSEGNRFFRFALELKNNKKGRN